MSENTEPVDARGGESSGGEGGRVVGRIEKAPDDTGRPRFKVVHGSPYTDKREGCTHRTYELHVRWRIVKCVECGAALDPFAVLMRYAEWQQEIEHHKHAAQAAEMKLLRENLRRLRRLVDTTDEEIAEIDAVLADSHQGDENGFVVIESAREVGRRIEGAVRERKREKRKKRRAERNTRGGLQVVGPASRGDVGAMQGERHGGSSPRSAIEVPAIERPLHKGV